MHDKPLIAGGLLVFVALITFPIWYNLAGGEAAKPPKLQLPKQEKDCVAPVEYMRKSHMDLLMVWREDAVRKGIRTYKAYDGKTYRISLTQTCLKCHEDKAEFCDKCHSYEGVNPYCWECHFAPKEKGRAAG
ncbi:MAG: sulfate reduction electron transfer complex DsrMKJOP subunit DsrJ [Acidobacteriota bacterium]|jgi:hypothetical protein